MNDLKRVVREDEKVRRKRHPSVLYQVAGCATFGGLLFGYDTVIINGALVSIEQKRQIDLPEAWKELIVASAIFAAAGLSIVAGPLADAIGRKPAIMISAIIFTLGALINALAINKEMILLGRIIIGSGMGISSCIVPVYVSECSPKDIRGFLITINQICISLGTLMAAIVAGFSQDFNQGWRFMFGLGAVPGLIQLICFIVLPESPRYMGRKYNSYQAETTLRRIRRSSEDVNSELREIRMSMEVDSAQKGIKVWCYILKTPHVRKALLIGIALQVFQKFSGIDSIIYFSSTILRDSGFPTAHAIWLSTLPFLVLFLATFPGMWVVESLGRKPVLSLSFLVIGISCCIISVGLHFGDTNSPATAAKYDPHGSFGYCGDYRSCVECIKSSDYECGYCALDFKDFTHEGACVKLNSNEEKKSSSKKSVSAYNGRCSKNSTNREKFVLLLDTCPSHYANLSLLGIIMFVLAFGPGAGPIPWTINAEIYPTWARSMGNSLAGFTNWMCSGIVCVTFMTMFDYTHGIFFVYATVAIIATVFVMVVVPETKGISLEEVEFLFMTDEEQQNHNKVRMSFGLPLVQYERMSGISRISRFTLLRRSSRSRRTLRNLTPEEQEQERQRQEIEASL